jgi:hypothetical protein
VDAISICLSAAEAYSKWRCIDLMIVIFMIIIIKDNLRRALYTRVLQGRLQNKKVQTIKTQNS